jgi:RNA polymerase sigma-70 factor (ECF subfamily)
MSEPPAELDDREVARRALEGDERAFALIVRRYQRGIYNLALRMVKDSELARDLAQDVFVRVHLALRKYDPAYPFSSWIYRVATNLCIDQLRRRKLETVSLDAPAAPGTKYSPTRDVPDESQDPARDFEAARRAALLEEALGKLPESHRMVLLLRHQRDLSYEEIARILDAPLGTVKARIHRAREAFRRILERDYDPEDWE